MRRSWSSPFAFRFASTSLFDEPMSREKIEAGADRPRRQCLSSSHVRKKTAGNCDFFFSLIVSICIVFSDSIQPQRSYFADIEKSTGELESISRFQFSAWIALARASRTYMRNALYHMEISRSIGSRTPLRVSFHLAILERIAERKSRDRDCLSPGEWNERKSAYVITKGENWGFILVEGSI